MTELQKEFCKDVAALCEAAKAPELYNPIIKLWTIYEDAETANTKVVDSDLNGLSSEQLQQNAAQMQQLAEQKKAAEQASEQSKENAGVLAAKMNEEARQNEQEQQNDAGAVNG